MFKNRMIQLSGALVLVAAVILVTVSAVKAPAQTLIPVTGSNPEGLAQYQRSERGAPVANPNGLAIFQQSERVGANLAKSDTALVIGNAAGMAQYHRSEWGTFEPTQTGLQVYHQSEWFGK